MAFLRRHSAKIFFAATCILLALSLCFSAYSLASYVSHAESDENAGAAAINCGFTISGDNDSFINAPFMLKMPGDTAPVRMNNWMETEITVYNHGNADLKYGFSFIFYLPKGFAESAMIQLLELNHDSSLQTGAERIVDAKKASKMYAVEIADGSADGELQEINETADGVAIQNEYQDMWGSETTELKISGNAVYDSAYSRMSNVSRTYIANEVISDTMARYVSTVVVTDSEYTDFCRITVNIDNDRNDYILDENEHNSMRFVLRLSLRAAITSASDSYNYFANKWSDFVAKYTGNALPDGVLKVPNGYSYSWDGDGGELYICESADYNEDTARKVTISECVGALSPSRMSVVFTQER